MVRRWDKRPVSRLPPSFCVLEFPLMESKGAWIYATCCMSEETESEPLELFLYSPVQSELHVELLTVICDFHRTGHLLGLGHTVNLGRPWLPGLRCDHGLISLPYLEGPKLEYHLMDGADKPVRFLWLLPITAAEREYKVEVGLDALECKFQEGPLDFLNPFRASVV